MRIITWGYPTADVSLEHYHTGVNIGSVIGRTKAGQAVVKKQ